MQCVSKSPRKQTFGSPCDKSQAGQQCGDLPNVTCQMYTPPGGSAGYYCRCKEDFKSCSADNTSVCNPSGGGSSPQSSPPESPGTRSSPNSRVSP